jgi:hypothetical protein
VVSEGIYSIGCLISLYLADIYGESTAKIQGYHDADKKLKICAVKFECMAEANMITFEASQR